MVSVSGGGEEGKKSKAPPLSQSILIENVAGGTMATAGQRGQRASSKLPPFLSQNTWLLVPQSPRRVGLSSLLPER